MGTQQNMSKTLTIEEAVHQAKILIDEQKYLPASEILMRVIKKKPDHLEALVKMSTVAERLENYEGALKLFTSIEKIYPNLTELKLCIANMYLKQGDAQKFFALLKPYKSYFEGNGHYYHYLGLAHLLEGEKKEAFFNLKKACEIEPDNVGFIYNYISQAGKKIKEDDHFELSLIAYLEENLSTLKNGHWKTLGYYTLFNHYHNQKEYQKAFKYLNKGAQLRRNNLPYPREKTISNLASIPSYFDADFFEEYNDKTIDATDDPSPVFILGMPRSGTTLLEQILHSHPDIAGIGEDMSFEKDIFDNLNLKDRHGISFPLKKFPNQPTNRSLDKIGKGYIKHIRNLEPHSKYIVNKSVGMFMFAGLPPYCLPKAKIIIIRRNPIDCCLSIYSKHFQGSGHRYSNDLSDLGEYYNIAMKIMDHWVETLPLPIYEIQYEDLVEKTEEKSREIIKFLNLPWNASCLEFYNTKKHVKTASVTQVRKPVYTSSMERWRVYENELQPLIEALDKIVT